MHHPRYKMHFSSLFFFMTCFLTVCGRNTKPGCLECRSRLSNTSDKVKTGMTGGKNDAYDNDTITIEKCLLETSSYLSFTNQFTFNGTGQEERSSVCSMLLMASDRSISVHFQCMWPKKINEGDANLRTDGINMDEETKCINEDDPRRSKIEIFPHQLFQKDSMGQVSCSLMSMQRELFCNFSIYLDPREYRVLRGENKNVTISFPSQKHDQIQWVAVGNNEKEYKPNLTKHTNGSITYEYRSSSQNDDFVLIFYHELSGSKDKVVLGMGKIIHQNKELETTSRFPTTGTVEGNHEEQDERASPSMLLPTNTGMITSMVATPQRTTMPYIQVIVPTSSTRESEMNKHKMKSVHVVILISVLALIFSVCTCLVVVAFRFYGKPLFRRGNRNDQTPEEMPIVDQGQDTHVTTMPMRILPPIPSDPLLTVQEKELKLHVDVFTRDNSESCNSVKVLSTSDTKCDANCNGSSGFKDHGHDLELEEQNEFRTRDLGKKDQLLKCQVVNDHVYASSIKMYYTVEDLDYKHDQC